LKPLPVAFQSNIRIFVHFSSHLNTVYIVWNARYGSCVSRMMPVYLLMIR